MSGDDDDVFARMRRDAAGVMSVFGRFAEGGLEGLFADPDAPPPPAPPPPARATMPRTASPARPGAIDVVEVVADGACSFCAGMGRADVRGRDGRVRSMPCPDCGGA